MALFIRARGTGHNDNGASIEMRPVCIEKEDHMEHKCEHKCNQCVYARMVISENGLHYSCILSGKIVTNYGENKDEQ